MKQRARSLLAYINTRRRELLPICAALSLIMISLVLFVNLADEIIGGDTINFDRAALNYIYDYQSAFLDNLFRYGTALAGAEIAIILTVTLLIYLAYRKRFRQFFLSISIIAGAQILNLMLKASFARDRPDPWEQIVTEASYSFPSGHAMMSNAIAVTVVLLAWRTRYRYVVLVGALIYVMFIGLSRLYLGVHYPTDIIGGWLMSIAWATLCWATIHIIANKRTIRIDKGA